MVAGKTFHDHVKDNLLRFSINTCDEIKGLFETDVSGGKGPAIGTYEFTGLLRCLYCGFEKYSCSGFFSG